jgi:hypothetical protein
VVELHDEVEGVAAFLAAETVEKPLAGTYLEGRGLFIMKGAQALEVAAARVLELQVFRDDGIDRDRVPDCLHVFVSDPTCHARILRPGHDNLYDDLYGDVYDGLYDSFATKT